MMLRGAVVESKQLADVRMLCAQARDALPAAGTGSGETAWPDRASLPFMTPADAANANRRTGRSPGPRSRARSRPSVSIVLRHVLAEGFFLAAVPRLSVGLIGYLETLREQGYWVDWWSRMEIEDRLRGRPDIAARFGDVVRLKEGG